MEAPKKKRAYAAGAYEFGANSAMQAGPPPGAPMPMAGGAMPPGPEGQQVPQEQLTQQFGQIQLGPQPVQVTPQMQQPATQMNQLIATDLVLQPFNVLELDLPPPQITLPPNVRMRPDIVHSADSC